ncbi:MAG: Helicase associated domain protein [Ruminococcus flavefaciens]|nr:Helicase associated domain protein [Ruminococcus flavefaciens]
MAINLFSHNQTAYHAAITMLTERGKTAIIHPTGTGKSFIGFKLCEDNPDKTICWLSPSRYIYQTQLENLAETSGGYQPENIKFFTYAKLMILSDEELSEIQPDYIILDEFHRCGAELWDMGVQKLLKLYPDSKILGLSATAIRYLDNQRNMTDELFDGNIASEMTLGEAIVRGILNPPKYILSVFSYQKDLEKYEKRVKSAKNKAARDAATAYLEALRRALDKAEKLDVLFQKHMEDKAGKYIVFCANFEHMQEMIDKASEWFQHIDEKPHIYSVYSDDASASKSFAEFKADNSEHLKLLYCIDALNEGVHIENISGVILLRPTVSPIIYKQQIGRALSASKLKNPVIFDIVNNIENLYSIDSIEEEMKAAIVYYRSHGGDGFVVNESFELIDKVADCKALFDELEGTLSASWDIMYGYAKQYFEKHGDLEVPQRYFTDDGYSLGTWIQTQRRVYNGTMNGILTQVQIDKLSEIGMRWWKVSDLAWEKYYASARRYYEQNGNLKPVATYADDEEITLGRWISQLRIYRKSGLHSRFLTKERIAALDEIGMIWDVPDYIWEENYAAAVRYHREHGDLNVPYSYVDSDGIRLGEWLSRLRRSRNGAVNICKELTEEQIARLDTIDMIWESKYEKQWSDAYQALCDYQKQHGNIDVPVAYKTESGIGLGRWLLQQRNVYAQGKLIDDRKELLDRLGMVWAAPDPWEEKFKLAQQFFAEYGHLNVPNNYIANGVWLNKWLNEQKHTATGKRKKKLTQEQMEKLCSIGFQFEMDRSEKAWALHFEQAKQYYEEHGNLTVSESYEIDGFNLNQWLLRQRKMRNQGKLSEKYIKLLDTIGMRWDTIKDKIITNAYETGISHLADYIQKNHTTEIPTAFICEDGYRLGSWIVNCRTKYRAGKMPEEYSERLQKLGVTLEKLDPWETHFEELKQFIEVHQTTTVPISYVTENGFKLNGWLADQRKRYKQGKLSEERAERLRSIGVKI